MIEKMVKCIVVLIALGVALTPTWLWLFAYYLLAPEGFWQKFILSVVGIWLLGCTQIGLLVLWLLIAIAIADAKSMRN